MFFKMNEEFWKQNNGYWTAKEICQQPETWKKTVAQIRNEKDALASFIARTTDNEDYDIITAKNEIALSDYIDNITWIGTLSGTDTSNILDAVKLIRSSEKTNSIANITKAIMETVQTD